MYCMEWTCYLVQITSFLRHDHPFFDNANIRFFEKQEERKIL